MAYYIGHSCDNDIRFKASSGGIGTTIIKYLLSQPEYGTSMSFFFNKEKCMYEPKLIYDFSDFNNCGSIYQDTDNVDFIKRNIHKIKGGIIVTCMPCQVRIIRSILKKNKIQCFIISFCCSGQTQVEGTWCYYKYLGVQKESVKNLQYRGNGWPSGIQITLTDDNVINKKNWAYPWNIIQSSGLFKPKRCHKCLVKTSVYSDISLADPWLEEYECHDDIGNSIVISYTETGEKIINDIRNQGLVCLKTINEDIYIRSQKGTIEEKANVTQYKFYIKVIMKLSESKMYRNVVTSYPLVLKLHNIIIMYLKRIEYGLIRFSNKIKKTT